MFHLTYKSLHGRAPQYISDDLHLYTLSRGFRFSDTRSSPHSRMQPLRVPAMNLRNDIHNSLTLDILNTLLKLYIILGAISQSKTFSQLGKSFYSVGVDSQSFTMTIQIHFCMTCVKQKLCFLPSFFFF